MSAALGLWLVMLGLWLAWRWASLRRRWWLAALAHYALRRWLCEGCWRPRPRERASMTMYHLPCGVRGGGRLDPNRAGWLCERCWQGYQEYWDHMWEEYHASRG